MNSPEVVQAFHYDTLDSTNEEAKRLVHAGQVTGLAYVLADHQTAGKGTQGRTWVSPPRAGLYLTIIHLPQEVNGETRAIPATPLFTLSAGVACASVLRAQTGLEIHLKPINDLYANQRKLGGILTESLVNGNTIQALITGVGINIAHVPRLLPDSDRAASPTSLEELWPTGFQHGVLTPLQVSIDLVPLIVEAVDLWHQRLIAGDTESIISAWKGFQLPDTQLPPSALQ
jgi:BirA family biotin operon repressor/biotin-[acetyl-CoA-carboxylase] ligase